METICRSLKLAPHTSVISIADNTVTFKAGQTWFDIELKEAGKFTEKGKDTDGGLLVEQDLDVTLLTLPQQLPINSIAAFRFIAMLQNETRQFKVWGETNNPIVITPNKQGNTIQLQLKRNSLNYLDL